MPAEQHGGLLSRLGLTPSLVVPAYHDFGTGGLPTFLVQVVVPMFTHAFLHLGPIHLVVSLGCLWIFGARLEARTSWWRFLVFYLGCCVLGGVLQVTLADVDRQIRIGSSAAIAAAGVGYLVLYPKAKVCVLALPLPIRVSVPVVLLLGFFAVMQFRKVQCCFGVGGAASIDYFVQLVCGLAGGLVLAPILLGMKGSGAGNKRGKPGKGHRRAADTPTR